MLLQTVNSPQMLLVIQTLHIISAQCQIVIIKIIFVEFFLFLEQNRNVLTPVSSVIGHTLMTSSQSHV